MAQPPCIGLSWPLTNPPFGGCAIYFHYGVDSLEFRVVKSSEGGLDFQKIRLYRWVKHQIWFHSLRWLNEIMLYTSLKTLHSAWKSMVVTLISSWDGLVSGITYVSFREGRVSLVKGFTEKETCHLTLCDPPDGISMGSKWVASKICQGRVVTSVCMA